MRVILKVLALPLVAALTLLVAAMSFFQYLSGWIFYIASFILGISGAGLIFTGNTMGGIGVLVVALLIFVLPAVAEWITDKLDDLNFSLKSFITG